MDTNLRTFTKTFSYRTAVAVSVFLTALAMQNDAGFGLKFVILSYTLGFVSFVVQEKIWGLFKWGKDGIKDLKRRSIAKTVTWRIWSFCVLYVLGLLLGLSSSSALEWTIAINIVTVVVHYCHERVWNLVKWGKA